MMHRVPSARWLSAERDRVRAHLEGALGALGGRDSAPRRWVRATLRGYIDAGRFPQNEGAVETPVFVDPSGARCAVAALLEASGEHALVREIATTQNLARVTSLAADPRLVAWLRRHDLSVAEAARIQPAYRAHMAYDWRPTAAAVLQVGGALARGGAAALVAPTVRLGLRRVGEGSDDHGSSRYAATSLMVEYAGVLQLDAVTRHQLGALVQWEPTSNHREARGYAMGGPVLGLAPGQTPAPGAQLGGGFALRGRTLGWSVEGMATLYSADGLAFRLTAGFGLVW